MFSKNDTDLRLFNAVDDVTFYNSKEPYDEIVTMVIKNSILYCNN